MKPFPVLHSKGNIFGIPRAFVLRSQIQIQRPVSWFWDGCGLIMKSNLDPYTLSHSQYNRHPVMA